MFSYKFYNVKINSRNNLEGKIEHLTRNGISTDMKKNENKKLNEFNQINWICIIRFNFNIRGFLANSYWDTMFI